MERAIEERDDQQSSPTPAPLHPPSSQPLSPTSEIPIEISFGTGSLGISFDWNPMWRKLQIASFTDLPDGTRGPSCGKDVLYPGLVLTKANGTDTGDKYDECVQALRRSGENLNDPDNRVLTFQTARSLGAAAPPPLNPLLGPPLVGPPVSNSGTSSPGEEKKDSSSPPSSPPISLKPTSSRPNTGQMTNRSRKSNASSGMLEMLQERRNAR